MSGSASLPGAAPSLAGQSSMPAAALAAASADSSTGGADPPPKVGFSPLGALVQPASATSSDRRQPMRLMQDPGS